MPPSNSQGRKMNSLIYIHGWESSGEGKTAGRIKEYFKRDFTVICPTLSKNPLDNLKQMRRIILDSILTGCEPLLVGSSWGGLFALYMSRVYATKTVLLNPSLWPSINLKKYSGALDVPEILRAYKNIETKVWDDGPHYRHIETSVIVGINDNVLDSDSNGVKYCLDNGHRLFRVTDGHKLESQCSFDLLKEEVNRMSQHK